MDRMQCIDAFLRAAKSGSFSQAGRDMGLTPQALSKRIRELEKWSGVRLFNRSTRHCTLTEEGERFHARCSAGFTAINEALDELHIGSAEVAGALRVVVVRGSICRALVAPLIGRFMDQYPKISIDLIVANQAPDLVEQRIDVGIAGGSPPTNCFARRIVDLDPVMCASKAYFDQNGRPKRIEELARHRCINVRHPVTGMPVPWIFKRRDKRVHLEFMSRLAVNDGDSILQVLLKDGGIGMLPTHHVAPFVRSGVLEVIFPSWKMPDDQGIHVFLPEIRHVPRKSRVFSDFIFDEIRKNPDVTPLSA